MESSSREEGLARAGDAATDISVPGPGERGAGEPFWRARRLEELSPAEWESLCDGCGRCCLNKLEDEDTGAIEWTCVSCRLLDLGTCRCSDYRERRAKVPDCIQLTPETVRSLNWLPATCAYRVIAEGADLAWWHPLVSGDPETVHLAGISVRGRAISESEVPLAAWEAFIVDWPAQGEGEEEGATSI